MTPQNFRLPTELVAALRAQAASLNLTYTAHVVSQLTAAVKHPHDVLKTAEAAR